MTLKEYAGHDQGLHVECFKDKLQGKLGLSLNLSCHLKGCDNWFTPEFQQQHTAALYIVFQMHAAAFLIFDFVMTALGLHNVDVYTVPQSLENYNKNPSK